MLTNDIPLDRAHIKAWIDHPEIRFTDEDRQDFTRVPGTPDGYFYYDPRLALALDKQVEKMAVNLVTDEDDPKVEMMDLGNGVVPMWPNFGFGTCDSIDQFVTDYHHLLDQAEDPRPLLVMFTIFDKQTMPDFRFHKHGPYLGHLDPDDLPEHLRDLDERDEIVLFKVFNADRSIQWDNPPTK